MNEMLHYSARPDIEVLIYLVFRRGTYMVMGCLVIVWIFLRSVRCQIHPDHQFPAPLYTDMEIMVSPEIGMECPFPRYISAFDYYSFHALHYAGFFFRNGGRFS